MRHFWQAVAILALTVAPAALARSAPEVSGNAGVVSDYRFRGVSASNLGPALQGEVNLEWDGFFTGAWGSTIDEYEGAEVEVDVYAGIGGGSETLSWAVGAYAYIYPSGRDVNYAELIGSVERSVGSASLGLEAAWTPQQDNVDVANKYLGATASYEIQPGVAIEARGGFEEGFYDGKWDWELKGSYTRGPITASLAYVDTDKGASNELGSLAAAGVVASLSAAF